MPSDSKLVRIINRKNINNHPIEATHTNVEALKIENALVALLVSAVDIIKNEFDDNPYKYNDWTVKKNVQQEVDDVFRTSTESFYKLGIDYVNRVNDSNPKFTIRDIGNITKIANDSTNWTMQKLDAYFLRESKIKSQEEYVRPLQDYMNQVGGQLITTAGSINTLNKLNSFDLAKNVKNIAVNTATRGIAMGTIDKARQMLSPSSNSVVQTKTASMSKLSIPQVLTKSAAKLAELNLSTDQIWSAGFQPAEFVPKKQLERKLFRQKDEFAQWGIFTSVIPGDLQYDSHQIIDADAYS
jgi:hypothetical protein